ncbi:site-specific integrase [Geomicrobium sp. JCM 19037]|uniref:site-specific integrase n=1 Tax=Geomicrobium sp. JCM 19037 TaxID=1460634 RepID=UPI0012682AC3|nr:site-specific integrase [Geomicrobium sp. JCM 19037]
MAEQALLNDPIEDFLHYCIVERGLADNTIAAYRRDLLLYAQHMKAEYHFTQWNDVQRTHILDFFYTLKNDGRTTSSSLGCCRRLGHSTSFYFEIV